MEQVRGQVERLKGESYGFGNRVCLSIACSRPEDVEAKSLAAAPEFPLQELRLDYLADAAAGLAALRPFLRAHPEIMFLGTCRPVRSGGRFAGSGTDEVQVLASAAEAGCRILDLSLETAEELGADSLALLRSKGAAVILSFHDFERTPALEETLSRMRRFAPDLYKIVPTANCLRDSLDLLKLLSTGTGQGETPVVGISMGEAGVVTRILGPRFGSAFTFAAAEAASATAPGQLSAKLLTELYRAGDITSRTRLFAVAGDPIHTSLSPLMHNTAFHEAGL
ncbi:MAG: type I 3-dehydroquinate dehydratase, partial [Rhodospirillales bacterium]|nr:type I 3-dehydroquinate dehydratase [Acetobacter sp.]